MEHRVRLEKKRRILLALVLTALLLAGVGSAVYSYRHYTEQREKYFQVLRQQQREAARNAAFLLGEVLRPYRELVFITATQLAKMNLDDDAAVDQFLTEKIAGLSVVDNFYFGRERDGKFLDSANAQLPPGYDPRKRPWYREAVAARGFIVTEPYRDAATGELCLTLAIPVYQQQELRGVLGLDIFLRTAQGFIANLKFGTEGYLWVTDSRGYILMHPNKALVGLNLSSSPQAWRRVRGDQDYLEALRANWQKVRGAFEGGVSYRNEKNEPVLAQFWTVPVWEWKVIATAAPAEVSRQLKNIALFNLVTSGMGLLSTLLLVGLSLAAYGLMHRKELQFLATHDFLTGLPNRYFLELNLKRALARVRRGRQSALLFLDFDNFKLINDTLGHSAGDAALKFMVNLLRQNLREGDLLARVGGDEFAVLLEGSGCEEAKAIAERLRRIVDETPVTLEGHTFNLSLSIGITLLDEKMDIQRILGRADAALYTAKENGGNTCVIVRSEEDPVAASSAASYWVSRIKAALREEGFVLLFQPVVGVGDAQIVYHEVLLRMRAEDGTLISPGSFIPVAERFGLMPQVDCWVVKTALKVLQANRELTLFVNLSAASIGSDKLLDCIITAIKESGIDPRQLGFEITETAVMKDFERAKEWLRALRDLGCRFALDDFGTGCASFSLFNLLAADYLDYLKIAGTFVRDAAKTPSARSIVQAITTVATAFGKKTVAEWVENEAILEVVKEIGVDYAQGFYLGKPQPEIKI
ncbi:diguanylate cyclase (GGDEF)-like protein [Thermodesulfitimonas autotrophica]|uniref:Diguanylate cyclase (GGDEF)-like protein n=1 Tax=Thermodesulfitimonas autotrophica TaxID=1894989 RepID=A0A3N5ATT6_9THEO|nr:EAL domain-containing protein [Thermodesulfitimonas autotrophica]RPF47040.1 diguanylate cyclase (GGDEF)-like protein [Thermodesulfitimonas autotrophica]